MNQIVKLIALVLAACTIGNSANGSDSREITANQPDSSLLAKAVARLIEDAIPREYEKRKDWGNTKNITVGVRNDGLKLYRRKKAVKHGVWKHYKIRLIEPEQTLNVRITNVCMANGRLAFTLSLAAQCDLWARAKVYQYGVHLIALETVGNATFDLEIDCEVGLRMLAHDGLPGVALAPHVLDARRDVTDFQLKRVSNAKGPIIRELGEELPKLIERELQGPKLVAKLNRAIDKKQDRLAISMRDLVNTD